jgi:SSS family solute:Na+ symporter
VSVIVAAAIVLSYITLGGLSAAIYNEVLQFFVIVAALLPLTIIGLHKVGGWQGLVDKVTASPGGSEQIHAWPGNNLSGFSSDFLSVIGLVFGLGFVLSFGYWTTNFVEVQRAMASKNMSAARRTPIIGSFPKMFVPFIVIIPGMIAAVAVPEIQQFKATGSGPVDYNDALLALMRDLLPNGMLGLAITGLLASFMAGMAANLSSFNTVMTYDLIERYILKDRDDAFYLRTGRWLTVAGTLIAIGTAAIASGYANLMDYLQQLFSFFNAPLFATFILGMFWKRMTATAGWVGLVSGTATAVVVFVLSENGVINLPGQGASFVGAGAAFVVDVLLSVIISLVTTPKRDEELKGLVYSLTPKSARTEATQEGDHGWYRKPTLLAGISLAMVIVLNIVFG